MKDSTLDLSDPEKKGLLLRHIRSLEGRHRISIIKERKRRSELQSRFYRGVVVDLFADWLRENGYDIPLEDNERAHQMLANKFLERDLLDPKTGEIIGKYVRSTAELSTVEFMAYVEQCAQWLAEFCSITVPEPNPFYEPKEKRKRKHEDQPTPVQ